MASATLYGLFLMLGVFLCFSPTLSESFGPGELSRRQTVTGTRGTSQVYFTDTNFITFIVNAGTPPQVLNASIDTGSEGFWVWPSSFIVANSSTAQNFKQSFTTLDADGYDEANGGAVWKDTISVGYGSTLSTTGMPIELADNVTDYYNVYGVDGAFGLGLSGKDSETPTPQKSWLSIVQLESPVFALTLSWSAYTTLGSGALDFGYTNTSRYIAPLTNVTLVPVASNPNIWAFTWAGFAIGTGAFNTTSNIVVVADTASPYTYLPPSITKSYYANVSGSAYDASSDSYTLPCSGTPPTFTFGVGSTKFIVPSSQLNSYITTSSDPTNSTCYGSIQSSDNEANGTIGTPFFAGLYTAFYYKDKKLGFAQANLIYTS